MSLASWSAEFVWESVQIFDSFLLVLSYWFVRTLYILWLQILCSYMGCKYVSSVGGLSFQFHAFWRAEHSKSDEIQMSILFFFCGFFLCVSWIFTHPKVANIFPYLGMNILNTFSRWFCSAVLLGSVRSEFDSQVCHSAEQVSLSLWASVSLPAKGFKNKVCPQGLLEGFSETAQTELAKCLVWNQCSIKVILFIYNGLRAAGRNNMVCCLFSVHQGLLQRVVGEKARTSHRLRHSDPALVCDRVHIRHRWTRGDVPGEGDRKISWEVSGGPSVLAILCLY